MESLTSLPAGSRGQNVARVLRSAITDGTLAPGDRLLETDLANQLGTSNGPIREALRQLETEGLVVSFPYRGAAVAEVSQEEIESVLVPIRILIERFTFAKALELLEPEDYEALRELISQMRVAADARDAERLAEADLQFHELIIKRSGQNHCLQLWRVIQPRVRSYFRRDAPVHPDRYAIANQHQELLDALLTGDPASVDAAVEAHIRLYLQPGEEAGG